ncbi:hypothetical protein SISSUDRAFT_14956 [Sistotremastrum suecicum HHB10207 ss-3]|uniref:Uncharacterized protein n=1 Tax=Sistotremastrum suecicum HHB10207 ss-3 TaxID=1314776 RepID=A0A166J5S3_9AGAM|nr:hypothetical protein SISSUDRAFT_14956 [Sistotremastrum suecicum HHB10207 ss-3]
MAQRSTMHIPSLNSLRRRRRVILLSYLWALGAVRAASGEQPTRGLAFLDSPAAGSVLQTGSSFDIAVDVKPNGSLPAGSALTSYNVYLISSDFGLNLTVIGDPQFLEGEEGSNVKHFNWDVPPCLQTGNYSVLPLVFFKMIWLMSVRFDQLTLYEGSTVNNNQFFAITPFTIELRSQGSQGPSGTCTGLNQLFALPQADSPPGPNNVAPAPLSGALVASAASAQTNGPNVPSTTLSSSKSATASDTPASPSDNSSSSSTPSPTIPEGVEGADETTGTALITSTLVSVVTEPVYTSGTNTFIIESSTISTVVMTRTAVTGASGLSVPVNGSVKKQFGLIGPLGILYVVFLILTL